MNPSSSGTAPACAVVTNRCEPTRDRGIVLGVNPRPGRSHDAAAESRNGEGTLRAVVFGAATHNTTLTETSDRLSGDYAGFASRTSSSSARVQASSCSDSQGFEPVSARGTLELARQHGETLGREVLRVLESSSRPCGGPLSLTVDTSLALAAAPGRAALEAMTGRGEPSWRSWTATRMREALDRGEQLPTHYKAPVAVWQFGADLTLVGLSGEVVVDYVALVEQAIGPMQLWLTA